jgi:hypothetical protein
VEGGRRAFYTQLEVEVVQGESKDSLKRRVKVDAVESKASRRITGVAHWPLFDV